MHILVVNDDGPPSAMSPYIAIFVKTLQDAGHLVSVVLPAENNSGMSKAYSIARVIRLTFYTPGTSSNGASSDRWVLVYGTPATCVQLGISHLFPDREPIDLVVSGPNYGHNLTSVYMLASGTVGGAIEGALCGKKAVSVSFAFGNDKIPVKDDVQSQELITKASRISLRIIEQLLQNWPDNVDVYSINFPKVLTDRPPKVAFTTAIRASLYKSTLFKAIKDDDVPSTGSLGLQQSFTGEDSGDSNTLKSFIWAPSFGEEYEESLKMSPAGTDVWAHMQGHIGITPIQAYLKETQGVEGYMDVDLTGL